jgi:1-acyl-sn-glycerol-3-phosphate acyltransferase
MFGMGMTRLLKNIYEYAALYFGLLLLGVICLSWTLVAMLLYPVLPRIAGGRLGQLVISAGFRIYLYSLSLMRACRFDLSALDALRDQPAMVIAPNHPCLLDAVMVVSRLPNVTCIMKSELMDNIFLGAGSRLAGYVRNDSIRGMIVQAAEMLRRGSHVLVFPEGTRTTRMPTNTLVGSFGLIARRAGVPVQTVFIETNSDYLSKGWPLFRRPSLPITYRVRLGKRFDAPENVKSFVHEVEQYFADEFNGRRPFPAAMCNS